MYNEEKIKKTILIIVISIILLVLIIYGVKYYKKISKESNKISEELTINELKEEKKEQKSEKDNTNNLMVEIKGEVKKPNTYNVDKDTRVIDVINLAGGLNKNADTSVINLSKKVIDEMVIIIYSKKEVLNYVETLNKQQEKTSICTQKEIPNDACITNNYNEKEEIGKVNINIATIEILTTLPSIGENKAKSIIEYRDNNGLFKNIEDIKNVSGIGDSIFDQIKNYITI